MKNSNEQLDDRVVEVHWDSEHEHWRMMRFRDDKPHGNHKSVVDNIIKSIADGIEKDVVRTLLPFLLSFSPSVSVLAVVTAARPCSDITLPFSFSFFFLQSATVALRLDPQQLEDPRRARRRSPSAPEERTRAARAPAKACAPATPASSSTPTTTRRAPHRAAVRAPCSVTVEQGHRPAYSRRDEQVTAD